jgi:hypothetical protein
MEALVICDTNIFYGINRGDVSVEQFKRRIFTLTHFVVFELGTSHTVHRNCLDLVKAAKAAKESSRHFILENPFDFSLKRFFPEYEGNQTKMEEMTKKLDELVSLDCNRVDKIKAHQLLEKLEKPMSDMFTNIHSNRQGQKKLSKQERKEVMNSNAIGIFKAIVAEQLEHHYQINTGEQIKISHNHSGWDQLELLLHVYTDCEKLLRTEPGRKYTINDWFDIWMMAYVGSKDKYYTKENKWIKIIATNPTISKYLYEEF